MKDIFIQEIYLTFITFKTFNPGLVHNFLGGAGLGRFYFNETVIPLTLDGYEMVMDNSALRARSYYFQRALVK